MSSASSQMFKRLFTSSPAKMLVLLPTSFEIVAVTDQYLSATRTREEDLLGKTLFEVFPDDPRERNPDGVRSLSRSLHRVQSLKSLDVRGVQRYPIPVPGGGFEERFWSPVNSPVLDDAGELEFIIHRVEDVTSLVRESLGTEPSNLEAQAALRDVVVRSQELRQTLSKLQEQEARGRTAERLLSLGAWEHTVSTQALSWSEDVVEFDEGVIRTLSIQDASLVTGINVYLGAEDPENLLVGFPLTLLNTKIFEVQPQYLEDGEWVDFPEAPEFLSLVNGEELECRLLATVGSDPGSPVSDITTSPHTDVYFYDIDISSSQPSPSLSVNPENRRLLTAGPNNAETAVEQFIGIDDRDYIVGNIALVEFLLQVLPATP